MIPWIMTGMSFMENAHVLISMQRDLNFLESFYGCPIVIFKEQIEKAFREGTT